MIERAPEIYPARHPNSLPIPTHTNARHYKSLLHIERKMQGESNKIKNLLCHRVTSAIVE